MDGARLSCRSCGHKALVQDWTRAKKDCIYLCMNCATAWFRDEKKKWFEISTPEEPERPKAETI